MKYVDLRIRHLCASLLITCLILSARVCAADSNLGLAYFAIQHPKWPCAESLQVFNGIKVPRLAILWNTFGTDNTCLKKFLDDPRQKALEIHLINEPCHRNKRCGPYEFLHGISLSEYREKLAQKDGALLAGLNDYFKQVSNFIKPYIGPKLRCSISPGLESNVDHAAAATLIGLAKQTFPECSIVWNPVNSNRFGASPINGTVHELHGSLAKLAPPCIGNLDGQDISFPARPSVFPQSLPSSKLPDYINRLTSCESNFLWVVEFNGLTQGSFKDPRDRQNFPTPQLFGEFSKMLREQEPAIKSKKSLKIK